ncbi:hypothetical protein O0L34_g6049 [Tuta absoluta]|nr:hypothetical protein O0L34_g6049 [Tuta absoluta]
MNDPGPSRDMREHLLRGRRRHGTDGTPRPPRHQDYHRSRSPLPGPSRGFHRSTQDNRSHKRPNSRQNSSPPRKLSKGNMGKYNNSQRCTNTQNGTKNPQRHIGFKILEEISQSDSQDILVRIDQRKEAFLNLIKSQIEKPDIFVLITNLMAKVSDSSFKQLKVQILRDICNSAYLGNFQKYLMDIPYMLDQDISSNNLYWKDQEGFWMKFVTFSECLVDLLPVTALQKCRSLIEDSSKSCLEKLEERHNFKLSNECSLRLTQLRERLTFSEHEMKEKQAQKKQQTSDGDLEPPEGFRELDVIPDPEELLGKRPFLRPNIVKGGYNDKEHYLDVQYRLLREDCFGPLREGIRQYIAEPQRWKYDHIRVYNNVRFLGPYIPKSQNNVGSMVQMDITSKKWPKRINWAHSKRFLYGSLMLFTRDKCNSIIVATLLDRNVQELKNGKFAVSIINTTVDADIYNDVPFVMIESEVYFEPYFQVLNALRAPDFPAQIPLEEYIIKVNPEPAPPAYLNTEKDYTVNTEASDYTFKVLDDESWPNKDELGFDESQYEAYKLALTKELAVIQGPPGTGKTYLGVKLAQALLNNLNFEIQGCLIMVICYTNHALDQFLEALVPITQSLARIGGRSRNENMDRFNINNLRQQTNKKDVHHYMMREKRRNLRQAVLKLENTLNCLDTISNGVLSHKTVESFIPEEVSLLEKYYEGKGFDDPLLYWLFEHCQTYMKSQEVPWRRFQKAEVKKATFVEQDDNKRVEPILDEFEDEDEEIVSFDHHNIKASFTINAAEALINHHLNTYRQTNNNRVKRTLEEAVRMIHSKIRLFNEMSALRTREFPGEVTRFTNFYTMKTSDRWSLYFRWANRIAKIVKVKVPALQDAVKVAYDAYEESRMIVDLELLKNMRVVGMTTSGAARLRKLLQALGPPIVIVEEAAEVLEAHIVTSLTKNCKHLILIGDHQQLRPSISNVKLVRRYKTNVSLFERMIENGVQSCRLGVQHRMRPEFAALISPHIYSDLYNHPSVQDFPNVTGMTSNLFFFNHDFQEQKVDDSSSRTNHEEADLTIGVANYLMQQGYHPADVTILTTYAGQMFYMRKQRENYLLLSDVKITVVDNYQGEESKIILLSLVRNNLENNVGFLKIDNRICVALSRAKEGLYIFGNIKTLKTNSDLWMKIAQTLESSGSLGTTLTLKCENHPEKMTTVSTATDLRKLPEGGCGLDCDTVRLCGHKCPRPCHVIDREHTKIKCLEKCKKVLCDLGHTCPLKCWQRCEPCKVLIEKELPCGHKKRLQCHVDEADPHVRCDVEHDVILPACGHKAKKCCSDVLENVLCSGRCKVRVEPCGHSCGRKCHVNDDPDHEKYVCRKPCARAKDQCRAELVGERGDHQCKKKCFETCEPCTVEVEKARSTCGHSQRVQCHEDIDTLPCQSPCEHILSCEHKCPKKCGEECGGCVVKVMKIIPDCNHKIKVSCSKEATRSICLKKCERVLSCGHVCMALCSKDCDPELCTETTQGKYAAPCGHQVSLPCNVYNSMTKGGVWKPELLLKYCTEPCLQTLACDHICSGSCGTCFQGRLHVSCSQTCNQLNICGHMCLEPCNQVCPPCNQPCEIKCSCGVRCNRLCGAPCSPCMEPCTRKCRHGACTRRCGEPCSRPPCDEACARRLPCGHRCRGLCGEPCPDICNICRPDDFPRDFLGDEYNKKDKFIKLQDCPHVFEVDDMDAWITNKPDQVKIPDCPNCRKPIINTYRYKDTINRIFKTEINPIKERVFGNSKIICAKERELSMKIGRYREIHRTILLEVWVWKNAFDALNVTLRKQKKVSLLKMEMQHQYLNILDMIGQCYKKYINDNLTHLKLEFLDIIIMLCTTLSYSVQKISQQQQEDIGIEIKRMNAIILFSNILDHPMYPSTKDLPEVVEALRATRETVLTWKRYNGKEGLQSLRRLQEVMKVSGMAVKQERELIVKAIGLKAGHWYKCENGHFYCIGECGGAMQTSRCVECNAVIGGQNHRLETSNSHAPEMDGSRFAAWSQEYNNMANFNMDDLVDY